MNKVDKVTSYSIYKHNLYYIHNADEDESSSCSMQHMQTMAVLCHHHHHHYKKLEQLVLPIKHMINIESCINYVNNAVLNRLSLQVCSYSILFIGREKNLTIAIDITGRNINKHAMQAFNFLIYIVQFMNNIAQECLLPTKCLLTYCMQMA